MMSGRDVKEFRGGSEARENEMDGKKYRACLKFVEGTGGISHLASRYLLNETGK